MQLANEVETLRERFARLEEGASVLGDWLRLEARAARALIHGANQLLCLQREMLELGCDELPDPQWYSKRHVASAVVEAMDEIRVVRMCAQSRVFELEAKMAQVR